MKKIKMVQTTRHIFGKTYTTEKIMVPDEDFGEGLKRLIKILSTQKFENPS